jgi:ribosomal protein L12E/L44/L45/RPP1/RPP2
MKEKMKWLVAILLMCTGAVFGLAEQTHIDTNENEWVINHSDNGHELNFRIKGKPEFTEDYTDLKALPPGGSVTIEEKTPAMTRKLEITSAAADGQLQRKYSVNGAAREIDPDGRQWIAGVILDAVRQSGYDVERRVTKIFARGGAAGVLEEVGLIKGDWAKGVYLRELLKGRQLDAASARKVVGVVARDISSAYEKRQVLGAVAGKYLDDKETLDAFAAAVATINSDYERGQALAMLVKDRKLTAEQLKVILPAAAKMSSDYEKAQALVAILKSSSVEVAAEPVFFDGVDGINTAYERAKVLSAVLAGNPDKEVVKRVVTSAGGINSDYEKAQVLVQAAKIVKDDDVRKMLVDVAKTIRSEYERGTVLAAATK